jgi:hypothetical protein
MGPRGVPTYPLGIAERWHRNLPSLAKKQNPGDEVKKEDAAVNAMKEGLTVGGHKVYAAVFEGGMGYRRDNTSGVATGDAAETIYMVASGCPARTTIPITASTVSNSRHSPSVLAGFRQPAQECA